MFKVIESNIWEGGGGIAFEQAFIISAAADTRISHHGKIWDELRRGLTGVWLYQW